MQPFDSISRIEGVKALDRPAAVVRTAVRRMLGERAVKDALHGVWLGHPLHPGAAQVALGCYLSATAVGLAGGRRREAGGLIAAGLVLTAPTAAAGWADWSDAHEDQQRVGLVHATLNVAGALCYLRALVQMLRGRRGLLSSVTGAGLLGTSAVLGGHMSFRQALGANHAEDVAHIGPQDWQRLGPLDALPEGAPVRETAGDVAVLVVRRGGTAVVLADRCPHLAAPLSGGEIVGTGGDARVVCPWHGSEFRLDDGCVVHGPATAPVPRFDVRIVDGVVEARIAPIPGAPVG